MSCRQPSSASSSRPDVTALHACPVLQRRDMHRLRDGCRGRVADVSRTCHGRVPQRRDARSPLAARRRSEQTRTALGLPTGCLSLPPGSSAAPPPRRGSSRRRWGSPGGTRPGRVMGGVRVHVHVHVHVHVPGASWACHGRVQDGGGVLLGRRVGDGLEEGGCRERSRKGARRGCEALLKAGAPGQ